MYEVRDKSQTVAENARSLTVAACYEHLMRLDDLIAAKGPCQRYTESRNFFAFELQRCLRQRAERHGEHFEPNERQGAGASASQGKGAN